MVGSTRGLVGRMAGSPPCYDLGVCGVFLLFVCLFFFFIISAVFILYFRGWGCWVGRCYGRKCSSQYGTIHINH